MILGNRFYPIDSDIAFIRHNIKDVLDFYIDWKKRILLPLDADLKLHSYSESLENVIPKLIPLTPPVSTKFLFYPAPNGWIIYLNNWRNGTDTSSLSYMVKNLKGAYIRAVETLDSKRLGYEVNSPHAGTTFFEFHDYSKNTQNPLVRIILLENLDGSWSLETEGDPLDFEDVAIFQKKRFQDRFNGQILRGYLEKFGIFLDSQDFFAGRTSYIVERTGVRPKSYREFTLEEARR